MEVICRQPVVHHVAEDNAVLRQGKEGVHKGLTELVVPPVEVESKPSTDQDHLGQDLLVLNRNSLPVIACLQAHTHVMTIWEENASYLETTAAVKVEHGEQQGQHGGHHEGNEEDLVYHKVI